MRDPLSIIKLIIFVFSISLVACSDNDNPVAVADPAEAIVVTGSAQAPGGQIALFESNKTLLVAVVETVFPGAIAGITGLEPVTGATVQLIRIDDDGNQIGEVLAETVTSITGDYSLALPTGVSLAGDLIVRITGNGGATMSAMVVDQAVDISPISQFVLDKFVNDDTLVLADLAVNEVVALRGRVEEFDLTATADLSTMIAALEEQVGQFIDQEIAIFDVAADDGTVSAAVAGNWFLIEFDVGLHDSDASEVGTFAMDLIAQEIVIADAGSGSLTFTDGTYFIDTFTNFTSDTFGTIDIFHEISLGDEAEAFDGTIDSVGNISLSFPFEEELQTVSVGGANDPEGDGPDFGWRYPPGSLTFLPAGNGNAYVAQLNEASVRFRTTDTNGDGVNDAIDPNQRDGDEVFTGLLMMLKQGSGMDVASLNGDYGLVNSAIEVSTVPSSPFVLTEGGVGLFSFDGAGEVIELEDSFDSARTLRGADVNGPTLAFESETEPATDATFPYEVTLTGRVTLNFGGDDELEGFANDDGSILAFVADESSGTNPNVIDFVGNELLIAVKLGDNMASSLDGANYRLFVQNAFNTPDGGTEFSTLSNGMLSFNAGSTSATITGAERGFERSTPVAQIESLVADAVSDEFTVVSVAANGAIELRISSTEVIPTTTVFKGYVSADGNLLILRIVGNDAGNTAFDLGMIIGVKQ